MKKLISIALVLALAVSIFALAGCSNDGQSSASNSDSSESATEAQKTETAKVSKFEAYLTYNPDEYKYDENLTEILSNDENTYIYAHVFDETEVAREKEQFDGRATKEGLTEVKYGEMDLDNYKAKTVTYKSKTGYSKEYFITFDQKIGDWAVAAEIFAFLGDDLSNEAKMDEIAKTLVVKPENKSDDK